MRHISDRIAVMYLGRVVEIGGRDEVFARPLHPYTVALLGAVPRPDPAKRGRRKVLGGDVPSPVHPPPGCPFHTRCPKRRPRCARETPELEERSSGHLAACFYPDNV